MDAGSLDADDRLPNAGLGVSLEAGFLDFGHADGPISYAVHLGYMVTAYINGKMLTWARTRAGLELERLAKDSITVKKLKDWEEGKQQPTQAQAMKLAQKLGISYAMLFMPSVPAPDDPPIPDLRTVNGERIKIRRSRFATFSTPR